jgi:hypothetical protein
MLTLHTRDNIIHFPRNVVLKIIVVRFMHKEKHVQDEVILQCLQIYGTEEV